MEKGPTILVQEGDRLVQLPGVGDDVIGLLPVSNKNTHTHHQTLTLLVPLSCMHARPVKLGAVSSHERLLVEQRGEVVGLVGDGQMPHPLLQFEEAGRNGLLQQLALGTHCKARTRNWSYNS